MALAVQLVRRPRLLLLDEPLAGLDWRTRAELIQLLQRLKSDCTMLVVRLGWWVEACAKGNACACAVARVPCVVLFLNTRPRKTHGRPSDGSR